MKNRILMLMAVISLSATCVQARTDNLNIIQDSTVTKEGVTVALADSAYIHADYLRAIELYEQIIESRGVSASIYLNLGNAYYKSSDVAKAILFYERAAILDPTDKNIQFNLELARSKTVDKVKPKNRIFLFSWFRSMASWLDLKEWTLLIILSFVLSMCGLALFFCDRSRLRKKISLSFFSIFLALSVISYIFASAQMSSIKRRDSAIIMAPSVTVRSTPSESGTELFIIHEGRKVRILDSSMKEWSEIELEDGNRGWLENKTLEVI